MHLNKIFIGKAQTLWEGKQPSAIAKQEVFGAQKINEEGFIDDEQANRHFHGGSEMAIHYYPSEHYARWQAQFSSYSNDIIRALKPGRFGENLSGTGLIEEDVCIGDIYQFDNAILQVSQGRKPCLNLSLHAQIDDLAYWVQKTCLTGWYFRIIKIGDIAPNTPITLVERPQPEWPIITVNHIFFNRNNETDRAKKLANVEQLCPEWRSNLA